MIHFDHCRRPREECELLRIENRAHLQLIKELQDDYDQISLKLQCAIAMAANVEAEKVASLYVLPTSIKLID